MCLNCGPFFKIPEEMNWLVDVRKSIYFGHILLSIITFQIEKDFELQYPSKEEFKNWSIFLSNWTYFTQSIVNIRRGSVKVKHALQLLSQLDSAELNKGRF